MHAAASIETVSDGVRDFVNTNLEYVVAGLAIALGLFLIFLAVLQRRRAEAEAAPGGPSSERMQATAVMPAVEDRDRKEPGGDTARKDDAAEKPEADRVPPPDGLSRRERRRQEREERQRQREDERERRERAREDEKLRRETDRSAAKSGSRRAQRKRARQGQKRAKQAAKRRSREERQRIAESHRRQAIAERQAELAGLQGDEPGVDRAEPVVDRDEPVVDSAGKRLATEHERAIVGDQDLAPEGDSMAEAERQAEGRLADIQRDEDRVRVEAERRLREAERMHREAEERTGRARMSTESQVKEAAERARRQAEERGRQEAEQRIEQEAERARREAEERTRGEEERRVSEEADRVKARFEERAAEEFERQVERQSRRIEDEELVPPLPRDMTRGEEPPLLAGELGEELRVVEDRLSNERAQRDLAIEGAYDRLREIEKRAIEAEKRAAGAERLARLKSEEAERERRLREVLDSINGAEERAREAERRAAAAELAVARGVPIPEVSEELQDAERRGREEVERRHRQEAERGAAAVARDRAEQGREAAAEEVVKKDEGEQPEPPSWLARESRPAPPAESPSAGAQVSLNAATFEQLRGLGMSVTQATRVLAHREHTGGFTSLDELEQVPGFPQSFLDEVKGKLAV